MADKDFAEELWRARKDAHLVHHRIADFVLHHDDRVHPSKLANLVKKYRKMMDEADAKARRPPSVRNTSE